MRIVLGISGASGVVLGSRVAATLSAEKHETHLVITKGAEPTIAHELGPNANFPAAHRYADDDLTAALASSSFMATVDAMIVAPTSMKTVAALAHGFSDTVLLRAADAMLRLRKRLVLVPRETPMGEVGLQNMLTLARMGAIVVPPVVGWYAKPKTIDDVNEFLTGKILDAAGVPNAAYRRWGSDPE
ncbi:MAG: UbiX family flavin prenyltransferase [Thermoplasmatota archaeon]